MFSKMESKSQWGELLNKASFKTFFHTIEWENFLEKELSWLKFERYIWKNELLLSVARCRLFGKEKIVSHPLCEYGGPLPLTREVNWASFLQDFQKFFGDKAKIKFHPYILQLSNPSENNTAPSIPSISTFWIEDFSKKSSEDLWNNFRKTLKQEIKKGEGFAEIGECQTENELRQFYDLYVRTVRRHKNIPLPFSFFTFFDSSPDSHIYIAKKTNGIIGGSIFLFYPPFIHYFISASDQSFRDRNVGHAILWHTMKKYAGDEYDYFDLGGTRKGSALAVFKRGWGVCEYPLYEVGGGAIRTGDSPFRNLLGFAPTVLTRHAAKFALWMKA